MNESQLQCQSMHYAHTKESVISLSIIIIIIIIIMSDNSISLKQEMLKIQVFHVEQNVFGFVTY